MTDLQREQELNALQETRQAMLEEMLSRRGFRQTWDEIDDKTKADLENQLDRIIITRVSLITATATTDGRREGATELEKLIQKNMFSVKPKSHVGAAYEVGIVDAKNLIKLALAEYQKELEKKL